MTLVVLVIAVGCVAFTNGANANFKGVASLYGSGMTSLRVAAWWGTGATFAGSLAAMLLSAGMLRAFSGKGLVSDSLAASPEFLCAVALGGAGTSFLATRFGFPVSTTHALVGALAGAGWIGQGSVSLAGLGGVFVMPLLFSPLLAFLAAACMLLLFRPLKTLFERRPGVLNSAHYLSAGAASFARGLNDTPKIAAPLLVLPGWEIHWMFLLVAVGIALGGVVDIRNVAETLGKKVTGMNPVDGLAACLVTSVVVSTASLHAFPVSTTHVSVGSLSGIGCVTAKAHWRKIGEVGLAWICTAPCGAVLAAIAYWIVAAK